MMKSRTSVALPEQINTALREHLLRDDGQEDVCLVTYRQSTGSVRTSALLRSCVRPEPGDRQVHGNASISGSYVTRVAAIAASRDEGVAICHSHPAGRGWQSMSGPDHDAESSYANLAREITGLPLVGMTLAGDGSWSARHWDNGLGRGISPTDSESVRVVGRRLVVTWNDRERPAPPPMESHVRTISCWGDAVHANLVRRRVLVVGLGSVGLDVAVRLAATGFLDIGIMDFDQVHPVNLDRLIGATVEDARARRPKVEVAHRLMAASSTAKDAHFAIHQQSICEPDGLLAALDYDVVISCVDRPWPRAVLNGFAYTDLVPVIDGGLAIDRLPGGGMRNATWRSHVLVPGLPCLECSRQLDPASVPLDIAGLLDDPKYIAGSDLTTSGNSNVALLSISVAASLLAQFVSLNVAPGGLGAPGPLQYLLSTHSLEHLDVASQPACRWEAAIATGDQRLPLTGEHPAAKASRKRLRSGRSLLGTLRSRFTFVRPSFGRSRDKAEATRR
jgi:hypothetical protein